MVDPYDDLRCLAIGTLSQLPSEEAVRVLCGMLDDQRDHVPPDQRPKDTNDGRACYSGNAELAGRALNQLQVRSEPGLAKDVVIREIPLQTWKIWYKEAQAGTRNLYFAGENQALKLK